MKRLLAFSSAVAIAAMACSSSSSSSSSSTSTATAADVDKAVSDSAKAWCTKVFACCTETASKQKMLTIYAGGSDVTQDACPAAVVDYLTSDVQQIKTALAADQLAFSTAAASQCLSDEANVACADFFALGSLAAPQVACAKAFTGKVADGQACTTGAACTSGFCPSGDPRVCKKAPAVGDACAATDACGTALWCDTFSPGTSCVRNPSGTCAAYGGKADGQACCANEECKGLACASKKCTSTFAVRCDG